MPKRKHLDIGFSTYGEEVIAAKGTTIGVDPEVPVEILEEAPHIRSVMAEAEHLPIKSEALERVTSGHTISSQYHAELYPSLLEVIRTLKPNAIAALQITLDSEEALRDLRDFLREQPVKDVKIRRLGVEEYDDVYDLSIMLRFRKI